MALKAIPEVDDVTLEVGDGLAAMAGLLEELVVPALRARPQGEDSEWLARPRSDWDVVTSDLFTVDPLIFPGGDIGRLAACGAINDLVAGGAVPKAFAVGLLMSASLSRATLKTVLTSLGDVARAYGVEVVCGDTKVLPGREPALVIWVTAIGEPLGQRRLRMAEVTPGHVLLVTGPLGAHSLAVLSAREGLGFERVLHSDVSPLLGPVRELIERDLVSAVRDLTRGGLVAGIWEGVKASGLDWVVDREQLPLDRDVLAASSLLGLDPLSLTNEGCMLLAVPAPKVGEALDVLRIHPESAGARRVGYVRLARETAPSAMFSQPDGERLIDYPSGIGVPRLC